MAPLNDHYGGGEVWASSQVVALLVFDGLCGRAPGAAAAAAEATTAAAGAGVAALHLFSAGDTSCSAPTPAPFSPVHSAASLPRVDALRLDGASINAAAAAALGRCLRSGARLQKLVINGGLGAQAIDGRCMAKEVGEALLTLGPAAVLRQLYLFDARNGCGPDGARQCIMSLWVFLRR